MPRSPDTDVFVFTRANIRELDRLATSEFGIPSIVLMENAARRIADVALDGLETIDRPRILIVCGPGNNGGDGFAAARHLHNAGLAVHIALSSPLAQVKGDAATNVAIIERMGLPMTRLAPEPGALDRLLEREAPDLVIDALLGTGLERPLEGAMLDHVRAINRHHEIGGDVLAADIPSGLDADTGAPLGDAVRASVTVTFAGLKQGFLALEAQSYLGEVVVADIGAPRSLVERLATRPARLPDQDAPAKPTDEDPPRGKRRRG